MKQISLSKRIGTSHIKLKIYVRIAMVKVGIVELKQDTAVMERKKVVIWIAQYQYKPKKVAKYAMEQGNFYLQK